jgi:hypothetical protein
MICVKIFTRLHKTAKEKIPDAYSSVLAVPWRVRQRIEQIEVLAFCFLAPLSLSLSLSLYRPPFGLVNCTRLRSTYHVDCVKSCILCL